MSVKPMTKSQLLAALAERAGIERKDADRFLDVLAERVVLELREGRPLMIPGIGKLNVRETPARTMRNPATGEPIEKPAGRALRMSVAKALKDAVN
ncbi:HU family DNA-binding protein (plasmid) [Gemmobacter fulvus]|uniref:HU family DNA-binding protein n=1 Tax=Gemmobacter fulvus TaxID=2840474 RepID=A0A975S493_9RHOB|nr:HU family DNA-binding protein [Gemmobacter fulvus]MBT9247965.1 HU family DNA-binding protein [Gemmobacter fulvus]QWK93020.1 HU family DNA-binding protein [Gemmobacter fulvus]